MNLITNCELTLGCRERISTLVGLNCASWKLITMNSRLDSCKKTLSEFSESYMTRSVSVTAEPVRFTKSKVHNLSFMLVSTVISRWLGFLFEIIMLGK